MYCPRCGGKKFRIVFGNCGPYCVYCCKYLNEKDPFTGEIDEGSLPVRNLLRAIVLRLIYNRDAEKRKLAKIRVSEYYADKRKEREKLERYRRIHKQNRGGINLPSSEEWKVLLGGIDANILSEEELKELKERKGKNFRKKCRHLRGGIGLPLKVKNWDKITDKIRIPAPPNEDLTDPAIPINSPQAHKLNFVPLNAQNSRSQHKQAKVRKKNK